MSAGDMSDEELRQAAIEAGVCPEEAVGIARVMRKQPRVDLWAEHLARLARKRNRPTDEELYQQAHAWRLMDLKNVGEDVKLGDILAAWDRTRGNAAALEAENRRLQARVLALTVITAETLNNTGDTP